MVKTQIVTCTLPTIYVDAIAKIIASGRYKTRSDVIREALRKFLGIELASTESIIIAPEKPAEKDPAIKDKPAKIDIRRIHAGWSRPE